MQRIVPTLLAMLAGVGFQVFADAKGCFGTLADGSSDLHGGAAANVAGYEDAGHACFQALVALHHTELIKLDG